jgi:hypothetical protein
MISLTKMTTRLCLNASLLAVLGLGAITLTSAQVSAEPGAPAAAVNPPAITTAQADAATAPPPAGPGDPEPPPEMTFGHRSARPQSSPVVEPMPTPAAPTRRTGRARTMEDVAGASVEELTVHNVRWRYSLNFFGDLSLGATRPTETEGFFGFSLGAQDVLIRGELGNNIVATTEVAFEPSDAGVGTDIERFNVRWQTSQFFVEAGRTHTGFGYWNNAYHHGRWLQPTIARPRWVAFEDNGGILPVHWVGAGVGARLPLGDATLNLMGTFGNGRGRIVDDVRNAHDNQAMKAFHASAELVGIVRPELRAGVAGIYSNIPADPDRASHPGDSITEMIGGAHIAYVNVPLLFISEGYLVIHKIGGAQWKTYGGFALVGYSFGRVSPYVEVERIASSGPTGGGPDPFFVIPGAASFDTIQGILGVRYDLSDWTALKAEYRQTHDYITTGAVYQWLVNWSWGF